MADTTKQQGSTALVERQPEPDRLVQLTASNIKTPQELADRIREMRELAFILTPMTATGAIAPGYEIVPVLEPIDPSVDPQSGRGADVYFQSSIHKSRKVGDRKYEPVEVSLNHYALLRILGDFGVNVHPTRWLQDGIGERYLWVCETDGDIIDFTGQVRLLPTGVGSVDARDGSPDIGEWTPDEWAQRVRAAEAKKANVQPDEQWKVKPEPINGWTAERVMQVRRFGRQLAKTKSLNGLARKLGVRQSYTIEELRRRPFVIMRPMFMPDMSDPRVRELVTMANLGARHLLFPAAPSYEGAALPAAAPVTHAPGEMGQTLDGHIVEPGPEPETIETAGLPADAEELALDAPAAMKQTIDVYHVTKGVQRGKGEATQYFFETKEGPVLFTSDVAVAKLLKAAVQDGQPRQVPTEAVLVKGERYRQVMEVVPVGRLV